MRLNIPFVETQKYKRLPTNDIFESNTKEKNTNKKEKTSAENVSQTEVSGLLSSQENSCEGHQDVHHPLHNTSLDQCNLYFLSHFLSHFLSQSFLSQRSPFRQEVSLSSAQLL